LPAGIRKPTPPHDAGHHCADVSGFFQPFRLFPTLRTVKLLGTRPVDDITLNSREERESAVST